MYDDESCPSAAHGTNRDPYGCYERQRRRDAEDDRLVASVQQPYLALADQLERDAQTGEYKGGSYARDVLLDVAARIRKVR